MLIATRTEKNKDAAAAKMPYICGGIRKTMGNHGTDPNFFRGLRQACLSHLQSLLRLGPFVYVVNPGAYR